MSSRSPASRSTPPVKKSRTRAQPAKKAQRPLKAAQPAEPSGPPAWKEIPAWAIIGRQDKIIDPVSLRAMAEHAGARIREIDASHVSMISHPEVVVDVIEQALIAIVELQPA